MNREIQYIYDIPKFSRKTSLANTENFIKELGASCPDSKIIHVAGTNGKGSVCEYLNSILRESGYNVGLFTSPHLVDINERIVYNDTMISDEEFEKIYLSVCINYDNYLKEFVIPDVVAFYIADSFYKKVLSKAPLYNYINSAIDIFNVRCDIDKLIPSIKKILRIKYNLKIVNNNPMILKKFY